MNRLGFNVMRGYDFKDNIKTVLQSSMYDDLVWQFGEEQLIDFIDAVTSNGLNRIVDASNKGHSMDDAVGYGFRYIISYLVDHVNNTPVECELQEIIVEVLRISRQRFSEIEALHSFMYQYVSRSPYFIKRANTFY